MPEVKKSVPKKTINEERPIFSWQSPEYAYHKKNVSWFLGLAIVTVAIAGVFLLLEMISGGLVVIVAGIVLSVISGVRPNNIDCALYQDGIVVHNRAYQFSQFKSFVFVPGDIPKIKADLVGQFNGEVSLPLKNVDEGQVRLYFKKHLPEDESKGEDLVDVINRILRF